ncbi:MAG: hypothetical protein AAGA29_12510 [Planctomycetota bacterium]
MDPRTVAESHYIQAAAKGTLFELRFRLLVGSIHELATEKLDHNLSSVYNAIAEYYSLSPEGVDAKLLLTACQLRNKLLHCDLSRLRTKLNVLSEKSRDGGVARSNIDGMGGSEILAHIAKISAGIDDGQTQISDSSTNRRNDVYGWLLESWRSGDFDEAAQVFDDAIKLLEKLRHEHDDKKADSD